MNEPTLACPNCKTDIKLTESLAAPLIETIRHQYEEKLAQKEIDIRKRENNLREKAALLAQAKEKIEEEVALKLKQESIKISVEEAKKARLSLAVELDQKSKEIVDLQEVLKVRDGKLAQAQQAQVALIRKQRELDDAKREMALTIEKQVQAALNTVRDQAKKEMEESLKYKVLEKEQTILAMQRQIEDLKRRAEQGSQQMQGEVQELELEALLRAKFPEDVIEPVAKGEYGGDVLQRVVGRLGAVCGTILWESKRTKNWSDGWLSKLRDDQRAAKAELAIIVSQTLPRGIETFDLIEDVWVVGIRCAIPVAITLRYSLIELAVARQAKEGQQTKMEMVYHYLTGPRFRQRVTAIVEKFQEMEEDLNKERKVMTKLWAQRQEQIHGVIEATSGMYGDLQGITGKTLQEIEALNFQLPEPENTLP